MKVQKLLRFDEGFDQWDGALKPTTYGDMYRFFGNQNSVLLELSVGVWQPTTMYKVGDVVRSQNLGGYFARCIAAGTSGDVEPIWAKDNTTSDASCKWAVYMPALADDLKSYATKQDVADDLKSYVTKQDVADAIKSALLAAFPVGTIIESMNNVNPSTYLGGTWKKMPAGYVTISAGTYTETQDGKAVTYDFKAGNTYGEAAHKLTVGEMPSHNHTLINKSSGNGITGIEQNMHVIQTQWNARYEGSMIRIEYAGGGKYHNNLPPSVSVYRFRRIA